jgi:hypothetical protein
MCLYTKYITNKKYQPNRKNNFNAPVCEDRRLLLVPAKCGKCIECRKARKREWVIRLNEEIRNNPEKATFWTLTISNEDYEKLKSDSKKKDRDSICKLAVKRMLERIRKKTKKSVRHWFITELGENTGRIHLHGICWGNPDLIKDNWKYGFVFQGNMCNEKTVNYVVKYMLKENPIDRNYIGIVLCSAGIGKGYEQSYNSKRNAYRENNTNEYYRLPNGMELPLPEYYRKKIYSEEEREKLWIEKQERGYRYICGEKVSIDDEEEYNSILNYYRERAKELYNENYDSWEKERHKRQLEKLKEYQKEHKRGG